LDDVKHIDKYFEKMKATKLAPQKTLALLQEMRSRIIRVCALVYGC
jgi:hypothetical protein